MSDDVGAGAQDIIERLREACAMHVDLDGRKEVAAAIDAVGAAPRKARDELSAEIDALRRENARQREMLERIMPAVGALVEGEHLTAAEWQAAEDAWREWRGEVDDGES